MSLQYGMEMLIEDGSRVARARLGSQFMQEFFGEEAGCVLCG